MTSNAGMAALKSAELEFLVAAHRRAMIMAAGLDQLEGRSEHVADRARIVPHDRQATASLGPVERKGADDDVSTGPHGLQDALRIGGTVFGCSQKMKGGAVMPHIIGACRLPFGHVGNDPRHRRGARAEAGSCCF